MMTPVAFPTIAIVSYSNTMTKRVGTLKIRGLSQTIFPLKPEVFPL